MAGGISLGGAQFTLTGNNQQLLQALAQARAATDLATKAMAAAQLNYARAMQATTAAEKAMYTQMAQQWIATAKVHAGTVQQIVAQNKQLQQSFNQTGQAGSNMASQLKGIGSTLATLTGFGAIASGALVVRESLIAVTDTVLKAEQAQRSLQAAYGEAAPIFAKYAQDLASAIGRPTTEIQQGVAAFGILQKQYGVTSDEIQKLTKVALDLNAAYGGDLLQTFRDVSNAIQGEPQALEKYGIALQQNAITNSKLLTDEQRKLYESMSATSQARIRLTVLMDGAKSVEGEMEKRAQSLAGSLDRVQTAWEKLALTLGTVLGPAIKIATDLLVGLMGHLQEIIRVLGTLFTIGQQLGQQAGLPPWLSTLLSPVLAAAVPVLAIFNNELAKTINLGVEASKAAEDAQAQAAKAAADTAALNDRALGDARDRATQLKKLQEEATKAAVDAENDAYREKKAVLDAEKHDRQQANEDRKKAALAAIKAEEDAAQDAYENKKALLEKERDAALDAAEERHRTTVRTLEAEQDAVEKATEYQIRAIEEQRDAALKAAEEKRDALLRELELEHRALEDARTAEDRALEDQTTRFKRTIEDRHKAILDGIEAEGNAIRDRDEKAQRGLEEQARRSKARADARKRELDDEKKAFDRNHQAAMDALEAEQQAADDRHDAITDQLEAEQQAADDRHDAIVRGIEDEAQAARDRHDAISKEIEEQERAAKDRHDAVTRALEEEADAARDAHQAILRGLEEEATAAKDAHDAATRQLDDQLDAAEALHDAQVRVIDDRVRAAKQAHDQVVRGLDDEQDAAERLYDSQKDAIDDLKDAEDDRHRSRLRQIDDEQKRQEAFIDAQLGALDEAERKEQGESTLAGLQSDLQKALSTGNASEIAAAQQAILDEQNKQTRDSLRAQLSARKDAAKAAADIAKQQADDEHDVAEQAIKDAQDVAAARLKAVKDSVDARKQQADDELDAIEKTADAEKRAAGDALARVKTYVDARKQQLDDELDAVQRTIDARKKAADDDFAAIMKGIADRKQAADDALEEIERVLDARKRAADDELDAVERVLDGRKRAADDEFELIKRTIDQKKDAADKELEQVKRVLDGRKLALDAQKVAFDARIDDEKTKLDDAEKKDEERNRKAKERLDDRTKHALEKLKERKDKEDIRYEEEQRQGEDGLKEAKRRISDKRTEENRAFEDRKTEINTQFQAEQEAIKTTAEQNIQASKDALTAYQDAWKLRKLETDEQYRHERDEIKATYDDPVTGLLPKLQKAFDETKKWYDLRKIEVDKQYENEQKAIYATYDHPTTGLFKKLEDIHNKTIDGLKHTEDDWQKNFADPIKKVTDQTFKDIDTAFGNLLKGHKIDVKPGDGGDDDGKKGGGGAGPAPSPKGGQFRPMIDYDDPNTAWYSGGTHGGHPAVDIFAPRGTPIRAPVGGRMESATYPKGGNAGWLYGDDGRVYYFAHANSKMASGNVDPGDVIGQVGSTGNAEGTSPHCHFAIGSSASIISQRDGSGDIEGDNSYWEGGEGYAPGGGDRDLGKGLRIENGYLVFTLFGQQYRIPLPKGATVSGKVGDWISQALAQARLPKDWLEPLAMIAAVESGERNSDGTVKIGTGNPKAYNPESVNGEHAQGLMQMLPSTFRSYFKLLPEGFEDDIYNPIANAAAAAMYIKKRYDDPYGTPYWRKGHFDWRGVGGYARGGLIPEPTLLVGRTLGPYAMAGEVAPEWVTPNAPGGGGPLQRAEFPIVLGNREVERLWITGYQLNVQRGRAMQPAHRRIV